jgi:hypothetical protein
LPPFFGPAGLERGRNTEKGQASRLRPSMNPHALPSQGVGISQWSER